ncbi:MAG: hypothetical protein ACREIA_21305 [Opitutaceae bacterium]
MFEKIRSEPLLKREMIGRRLLGTSREMLYRINMPGMAYRIEKDPEVLKRIDAEVLAVCRFPDWNPSHYLDVAEMSMAVALAVDRAGDALPASTVELATDALIEKGIKPSYNEKGNVGWITGENNWNQVCHGGMIAASIVNWKGDGPNPVVFFRGGAEDERDLSRRPRQYRRRALMERRHRTRGCQTRKGPKHASGSRARRGLSRARRTAQLRGAEGRTNRRQDP